MDRVGCFFLSNPENIILFFHMLHSLRGCKTIFGFLVTGLVSEKKR